MSFEEFISDLAKSSGFKALGETLEDAHLRLMISVEIAALQHPALNQSHVNELRVLFRECDQLQIGRDGFERLRDFLERQIFTSERQDSRLLDRINVIEELWMRITSKLTQEGWLSPEAFRRQELDHLTAHLGRQTNKQGYRCVIAGLTSLSPSELRLMPTLCQTLNAEVWMNQPSPMIFHHAPAQEIIDTLCRAGVHMVKEEQGHTARRSHKVVALEDTIDETEFAVHQLTGGNRSEVFLDISLDGSSALLVTDENQYRHTARQYTRRITAKNFAIPSRFRETPAGTWLQAFHTAWSAPAHELDLDPAIGFFTHPVTLSLAAVETGEDYETLSRAMVNWLAQNRRDGQAWKASLRSDVLNQRLSDYWGTDWRKVLHPDGGRDPFDFWQAVSAALTSFNDRAVQSDDLTPVIEWLATAIRFLRSSSIECVAACHQEILNHLGQYEYRTIGEPLSGLQVLSVAEARMMPFHRAVVIGCSEGLLPHRPPQDELLDDTMKRQMGLRGWEPNEALAEQNFFWLVEQTPELILLYPKHQRGEIQLRSRYIEQLLAFGRAQLHQPNGSPSDPLAADRPGRLTGIGHRPISACPFQSPISPSRLAALVQCPYRFEMLNHRVQPVELSPRQQDPRIEGELLHKILEKFFQSAVEYDLNQNTRILNAITDQVLRDSDHYGALRAHLKLKSWPELLRFLHGRTSPINPSTHRSEVQLADLAGMAPQIQLGALSLRLKGRVDLVVQIGSIWILMDFKRNHVASPQEVNSGIEPQLILYASALAQQQGKVIAGYFSIGEGKWHPRLGGTADALMPESFQNDKFHSLSNASDQLGQILEWRLNPHASHQGFAVPDVSRCGMCELTMICRKSDVAHSVDSLPQQLLAQRLPC